MRAELPSGTVTFLFTDVEGSTRLLHELGAEAYAEALAEHRRVIREACAAEGGVEVDTQGDAFFFAFPTAPGAIAAAAAFTEELASSGSIQVRAGVHTGAPLLTDEGYVGDDVHLGSRIASAAHGGQVLLSNATAKHVEDDLTDLGEHRLKDIDGPVVIYQLGDASFPPLKTISNTNLPRAASSFLGREHEVADVLARIERGARLVTLTGPGGTGKTRLAIEAASNLVPDRKAGVFWVGLASLRDPALVTETIAQTLGAKDELASHIGDREMLLLLDNLEQVIECSPELSALLTACPNLTLLVTSRELLRIHGEVEFPVPPLAGREAVDLFCERSQLVPSEEIAELCGGLDSLPLAVELAAARTKALTPAQILERLSQRLDLLKGGRDADPRQQTLRTTIEWSYDLLSADEQRLFSALSVFAGGCTLEAAERVCDADIDTLQSLVEKSLLRFGDGRYWMLETIREYARERLEAAGRQEVVRRSQAAFFARMASTAEPALFGRRGQSEWVRLLAAEHSNITAAVLWAEAAEPSLALELVGSVWRFWWYRGHLLEGFELARRALEADGSSDVRTRMKVLEAACFLAYRRGDIDAMASFYEEGLALSRARHDEASEGVFLNQVALATHAHDPARAAQLYEESARLLAGHPYERYPLGNAGAIALRTGDVARARIILGRVLVLDRASDDEHHLAHVASWQAVAASLEGDHDEASALMRESLTVASALGANEVIAEVLAVVAGAVQERAPERAAALIGASDQVFERDGAPVRDVVPGMRAKSRAQLESTLGDDGFSSAYEKGRRLSIEAAVSSGLAALD